MASEELIPLLDHLERSGADRSEAARVVDEVLAYFSESAEEFVRRRHRELQRQGIPNAQGFTIIAAELGRRRVVGPRLSERQVRRMIYG